MSGHSLLRKDQLEIELHKEKKLIEEGIIKEDNPFDDSEPFLRLCAAARRGDLKTCQETIQEGVNINAKDQYDYTPLILASLCGHYETVELLLESGALCERDTFQGERCLYNALNDRIRNLLLAYDYSKSTDPLQPLASHLTSLLFRTVPNTADITVTSSAESEKFALHKFILAARSPYFRKKLNAAPDTTTWKLPSSIPPQSFGIGLKYLYLGELPRELGGGPGTGFTDLEVLNGVSKICKHLEIQDFSDLILEDNKRLARQKRQDEVARGGAQLDDWFRDNVLRHAVHTTTVKANQVKWDRNNGVFADILLCADEEDSTDEGIDMTTNEPEFEQSNTNVLGIPLFSSSERPSRSSSRIRAPRPQQRNSVLYPCHKAMLLRSDFFATMFSTPFVESSETPHLQIVNIDCSPAVLEIILTFLYTESANFNLDVAVDVLFAADMLFLEKLKQRAAQVISTLGNGIATAIPPPTTTDGSGSDIEDLDIYEILRAAWTTRVQRLEEFAARYMAYRLEKYIDDPEFAEIVLESAGRISKRQETDSIEILDDIRFYLSERFRLRFEDLGMDEVEAEAEATQVAGNGEMSADNVAAIQTSSKDNVTAAPGSDSAVDLDSPPEHVGIDMRNADPDIMAEGVIRTLDGEIAGDEFEQEERNYRVLLEKIDLLLAKLRLDA